jgi:hypothetical protein
MNKELIEALKKEKNNFSPSHDSWNKQAVGYNEGICKAIELTEKALQKAKEQPTKNAEEFRKELEKEREILLQYVNNHSRPMQKHEQDRLDEINYILFGSESKYSNQSKKTITEEEIEREADRRFQLIADLNTIEACYNVEFGDIEKAAEYIIAKGD